MVRKPGDIYGRHITLPPWWLNALNRLCKDLTVPQITDALNGVTRREPPFERTYVGNFLAGRYTTTLLLDAFLLLFPELPPPMFFAHSYEEAHQLMQVSRRYNQAAVSAVRRPGPPTKNPAGENGIDDKADNPAIITGRRRGRPRKIREVEDKGIILDKTNTNVDAGLDEKDDDEAVATSRSVGQRRRGHEEPT